MTLQTIIEAKEHLRDVRREAAQIADTVADRYLPYLDRIEAIKDEWQRDNAELIDLNARLQTDLEDTDTELRNALIAHYEATGEKKIDVDLSVRVLTKFSYSNAEAVKWAETNAPVMIVKSVDKKAFESLPTVEDLGFVTKIETPSAVIAKELK